MNQYKIGIIMGSKSDWTVMKEADDLLKQFDLVTECQIVSAHRTPHKLYDYATKARAHGIRIIIAGAGGAAHLPGMVASLTNLPVIGVPIKSDALNGIDSLYSIVQMPTGVPVATVGINGAKNAALLALRILSLNDEITQNGLNDYIKKMTQTVLEQELSAFKHE